MSKHPTAQADASATTSPADTEHPCRYTAALANQIESRWQARWEEREDFRTPNPGTPGFDPARPKFYCLDMFPYPSGSGLHVGHPEGYTATDIVSRSKRMRGFHVLHPMGWDAFGLPAEQYAIQSGVHPATTTRQAIDTFRRQLKRLGFSYDWSRELATMDPPYYRWTQWIWLQAYHAWFDRQSGRARRLDEMIRDLESDRLRVDASGAPTTEKTERCWQDLAPAEQRRCIDGQRLAYLDEQTVNWCPKLGTALANEEVIDGKSERGGYPVYRRPLKQWMFRITAFADRLLADLDHLDWPASTRIMQTEWIGRSEGAWIDFPLDEAARNAAPTGMEVLRVFTTRPDTVFGATYMVLAPEHPLVKAIVQAPLPETDAAQLAHYVEAARHRSEVDRMAETREKTGVFTGACALNPANGQRIPIWVADYVLMGYGTGAIMAVPAHDQRDHDFARAFDLPITQVVASDQVTDIQEEAWVGDGVGVNSRNEEVSLDGLPTAEAKRAIIAWLEARGLGCGTVQFKLRDWLFSRQRYWGEPFPIVYDEAGHAYPVDASRLPVELPPLEDYQPIESDDPAPLLAKATDWIHTTAGEAGVHPDLLPPETPVRREANTMPGWAGSCWYYLRFCDPENDDRFVGREIERYWMGASDAPEAAPTSGVDLYIGGAEHAVLHLLYARFWHKLLFDLGEVSTPEPFRKVFHQGIITSFAFQREDRSLLPADEVQEVSEGAFVERATGRPVTQIVAKMSKALKNVVNPDEVIAEYGADTFRLYEMYMGPLDASKPWNPRDIVGVFRFLQRLWRLVVDEQTGALTLRDDPDPAIERQLHRTIAKVQDDIERLAFNTAIASMIELVNAATAAGGLAADQLDRFVRILAPFVPHIAEELWSKLGREQPLAHASWPAFDEAMLTDDQIELPVQIQGKVRGRITVPTDAAPDDIEQAALRDERIRDLIGDRAVRKVIVVPGRIVNIITA